MGTELLLKARIAAVSPYLLIDKVTAWPKNAAHEDAPFDEFRTVDAHALPQIFNSVCGKRLDDHFMTTIKRIRKRRNAIVHAASDKAVPTSESIVLDVLEVSVNLIGEGKWPAIHRAQVASPPFSRVDYHDQIQARLLDDFEFLLEMLNPSQAKRHLGFSKRQRRYYCPSCRLGDVAPEIKMAFLQPNKPHSTTLYCIACGDEHVVARESCTKCVGNVIDEDGTCLLCTEYLERPMTASQLTPIRRPLNRKTVSAAG